MRGITDKRNSSQRRAIRDLVRLVDAAERAATAILERAGEEASSVVNDCLYYDSPSDERFGQSQVAELFDSERRNILSAFAKLKSGLRQWQPRPYPGNP